MEDKQEVSPARRWALDYVITTHDAEELKVRNDTNKTNIKGWMTANCDRDENGNYVWEFDEPIIMDGEEITGFVLERRVSEFVNEDRAWELVNKYGLKESCVVMVEELDCDMLYVHNQRGIISDEEIDGILEQNETFALKKNKR